MIGFTASQRIPLGFFPVVPSVGDTFRVWIIDESAADGYFDNGNNLFSNLQFRGLYDRRTTEIEATVTAVSLTLGVAVSYPRTALDGNYWWRTIDLTLNDDVQQYMKVEIWRQPTSGQIPANTAPDFTLSVPIDIIKDLEGNVGYGTNIQPIVAQFMTAKPSATFDLPDRYIEPNDMCYVVCSHPYNGRVAYRFHNGWKDFAPLAYDENLEPIAQTPVKILDSLTTPSVEACWHYWLPVRRDDAYNANITRQLFRVKQAVFFDGTSYTFNLGTFPSQI
ncbi:MAG: hypothetical protein EBX40_03100, partial [Gammaproteobacteria bacterium]|nr:hypothetical protein [Gammaproteobacteria bacterium]